MNCNICKRELSNTPQTRSYDCGGDCLECMAIYGNDPEYIQEMLLIYRNEFYQDYSHLVNQCIKKAVNVVSDSEEIDVFKMQLQELSNVYSRAEETDHEDC